MFHALMVDKPAEDSNADVATVVDLVDSESDNYSSSTCCIAKYFSSCNRRINGNDNGSGDGAIPNADNDDDKDDNNGLILTQPDDVIANVLGNNSSLSSASRDDDSLDDDATGNSGSSMPSLMHPGL